MRTRTLICMLALERASHIGKTGNGNLRKVRAEVLNASTAVIASLHHHLSTYSRTSSLPASEELLIKMRCVRPQAPSSALGECASTCSVDPEALMWCISVWGVGVRSRVLRAFSSLGPLQCSESSYRRFRSIVPRHGVQSAF